MFYNNPYQNIIYQPQQTLMPNQITGRIVNDFSEITANEIPMDGKYAPFIKSDLSEVVIRKWESNGTISNLRFKAILDDRVNNLPNEEENEQIGVKSCVLEQIKDDIRLLNEKIDRLAKQKAKKEVIIDEQ